MKPVGEIETSVIDEALRRRSVRLRFVPALERLFESEMSAERCRRLIVHNWIGLTIYLAFMAGDWLLVRDVFWLSVALHLCVMTPIMLVINGVISRNPPVWLREGLLAGGIVLTTSAIVGLMLASRSPLRTSEHISVVLVILFATILQRIRFAYVVVACLASAAVYIGAVSQLSEGAPWERKAIAAAVFCGTVLFSVIGCWHLEREQRTNFLLRLLDKIRHRELETLSRRDALTGAGNRRALDETVARRQPPGAMTLPTAVLLFDIDHFKSFNDANGHLAGDGCLRRVAAIIAANVRDGLVYRFGGEEFLVLLEGAGLAEGCAVAERVRLAVAGAAISRGTTGAASVVTLSAGVAAAVLVEGETIDLLIADADLALYAAKRAGRDQVRAAPPAAVHTRKEAA